MLYNPEPNIPRVIACIVGTYYFIPKTRNFRSLLKLILIVAPNDYIPDGKVPYFSNNQNNDTAIILKEFERDADTMRRFFLEDDIILDDMGYRDATELLGRLGI